MLALSFSSVRFLSRWWKMGLSTPKWFSPWLLPSLSALVPARASIYFSPQVETLPTRTGWSIRVVGWSLSDDGLRFWSRLSFLSVTSALFDGRRRGRCGLVLPSSYFCRSTGWQFWMVKTSCWHGFGMFRHPAWAVGSYRSSQIAARTAGGYYRPELSSCT